MPQLIASVEGIEIKHVHLKNDRTTLGRNSYNDIIFDNRVVSGEHCVFEIEGIADVYVQDLASTNGTYVNGHMIKSRQLLHDRDILKIGSFQIQFLASSAPESVKPPINTRSMSLEELGMPGISGVRHASLKVLTGSSSGLEVPLVKVVTTFGQPGVGVVAISHRRDGYYVAYMEGKAPCYLNGKLIGPTAIRLAHHDVMKLAGTEMEFALA